MNNRLPEVPLRFMYYLSFLKTSYDHTGKSVKYDLREVLSSSCEVQYLLTLILTYQSGPT